MLSTVLFAPAIALAQNLNYFASLLSQIQGLLNTFILPLAMAVAVLYFFWAVIGYIRAEDDKTREEKRKQMGWGIVGLFVMVAVWGLVAFLGNTLGVNQGARPRIPCPPGTLPDPSGTFCL